MFYFDKYTSGYYFLDPDYEEYFKVEDHGFTSVTQYVEYSKAKLFGDLETAHSILTTSDPAEQRRKAKQTKGFNEIRWRGQLGAILYRGLLARYEQRPKEVVKLLETGEDILVYCYSADTDLGIRESEGNPNAENMETWTGMNLLGFALMEVREHFRKMTPEESASEENGYGKNPSKYPAWGFPSYIGMEPYVYLSFAYRDTEAAQKLGGIMKNLGYHVWYDTKLGEGRIWTGERSKAIEDSIAVVELSPRLESTFLEITAREFADLLGIDVVTVDTRYVKYPDENGTIHCSLEDETLPERLQRELLRVKNRYDQKERKNNITYHDLQICYKTGRAYSNFALLRDTFPVYCCNLRTREVYTKDGKRVMNEEKEEVIHGRWTTVSGGPRFASEEDVYRAILWQSEEYRLVPRSTDSDYRGYPQDWEFARRLADDEEAVNEEISKVFREFNKRAEQAKRDYPYMDEFEYLNSGGEDD